jgi:hypothetical protein
MSDDIKDLLALAVPDHELLHAGADAATDLARGRRNLRRRRLALVVGAAVAVVAVAGGVVTGVDLGGTSQHLSASGRLGQGSRPSPPTSVSQPAAASVSPSSHQSASPKPGGRPIALVAYTGQQVPGYQVTEVPAGWTIQGGNAFVLALAPIGYPNKDIDSFMGKLVVTSQSASETSGDHGTPETVDGKPGRFWTDGGYEQLIYRYTSSTWVDVQAPPSLDWDATQLVAFADGVTVLANAQQSKG